MKQPSFNPAALNTWPIPGRRISFEFDGTIERDRVSLEPPDIDTQSLRDNFKSFNNSHILLPAAGERIVSAHLLNRDANPENGLVGIVPSWLTCPSSHPGNQLFYSIVAATRPDTRFLILDSPGIGESSLLPPDVFMHTLTSGNYGRAGRYLVEAAMRAGLFPTEYAGNSSGARFVLGAASHPDTEITSVVMSDPAVASTPTLLNAYLVGENKYRSESRAASQSPYRTIPEELEANTVQEIGPRVWMELGALGTAEKIGEIISFGTRRSAFAEDAQAALDAHPDLSLSVISPECSKMNPDFRAITGVLGRLTLTDGQTTNHYLYPNTSHSSDDAYPEWLAAALHTARGAI